MAAKPVSKGKPRAKKNANPEAKVKSTGRDPAEVTTGKKRGAAAPTPKKPPAARAGTKPQANGKKAPSGGGEARATSSTSRALSANGHASASPTASGRSKESRTTRKAGHAGAKVPVKTQHPKPRAVKKSSAPTTERHSGIVHDPAEITAALHRAMDSHVAAHSLGRVTRGARFDWGEIENPDLRPDLAFVSYDRWAPYRKVPSTLTWHVVPDLVIEVLDRTEKVEEIGPRLADYFHAGVSRVWVVDPRDLRVRDYRSATEFEILGQLSGGTVLPGFEVALAEVMKPGE